MLESCGEFTRHYVPYHTAKVYAVNVINVVDEESDKALWAVPWTPSDSIHLNLDPFAPIGLNGQNLPLEPITICTSRCNCFVV